MAAEVLGEEAVTDIRMSRKGCVVRKDDEKEQERKIVRRACEEQ